jgi:sterol desaturase/sphingolipid hydroxylase (fatty acid hydroxylase superfamily)
MYEFRESLLVIISVPLYAVVIGFEIVYSHLENKQLYSKKGVLANSWFTILNLGLDAIIRGMCLIILNFFFVFRMADWTGSVVLYWIALVLAEDFMFYWLHRIDHHCRFFWAIHVTHHSSEEFNFTVGFRSSVLQPLYRFIYFIPLALAGFKSLDILFVYSATQSLGILVHTQTVGRLGWLEYIFVTPSHHRVHHACNVRYLDRNMGMLFIFWDKLFGTFQPELESEPVKYGLTHNIETMHPLKMIFHEWKEITSDLKKAPTAGDRWKYVFGPPGWSHDGSRKTSRELREELEEDH